MGTGNYTDNDRRYWQKMQKFWENVELKKSRSVIHVDFKNKKVIKGTRRVVKEAINSYKRVA